MFGSRLLAVIVTYAALHLEMGIADAEKWLMRKANGQLAALIERTRNRPNQQVGVFFIVDAIFTRRTVQSFFLSDGSANNIYSDL
jgi:hypothetical protein